MNWIESDNTLKKTFTFKDFSQAFGFMSRVALAAEKKDHHPTWTNTYNTVHIELCTHEAGDTITQKDRDLASLIDALV